MEQMHEYMIQLSDAELDQVQGGQLAGLGLAGYQGSQVIVGPGHWSAFGVLGGPLGIGAWSSTATPAGVTAWTGNAITNVGGMGGVGGMGLGGEFY
jgi:hypothetical protein